MNAMGPRTLLQLGAAAGLASPSGLLALAGPALARLGPAVSAAARRLITVKPGSQHSVTNATHDEGKRVSAGEKLLFDLQKKGVRPKMPWDSKLTPVEASLALGSFLGTPGGLRPGDVTVMGVDQMAELLRRCTGGPGGKGADAELQEALFVHANTVTQRFFGDDVYMRGIIEFSNVCENDCYYCGIRKHQRGVYRYTMPVPEIVETATWAFKNGIHTIMLQGGELRTPKRHQYLLEMVKGIREATVALDIEERIARGDAVPGPGESTDDLGIVVALSAGQLSREEYKELFDAGARRYLLRIETSNPDLFSKLHPPEQTWESRVECLRMIKDLGFQVATGVMVGLPGQTPEDLASDIHFLVDMSTDMVGMGPYIREEGTPTTEWWDREHAGDTEDRSAYMKRMVLLTMRMNALARINLGNSNIAATTALQAIDPMGREIALSRGANILMPILTPTKFREHYQLYEGKPCITDTAEECRRCLDARVHMVSKELRLNARADPPHFANPLTSGLDPPGTRRFSSGHRFGGGGWRAGGGRGYATGTARASAPVAQQAEAKKPGPVKGSDVPRINIGVFGSMNAGKSTLMNRITRQETSIVDATPGTTADTKISLMELHDVGPTKLFDTAGIDEAGMLGDKKRAKTMSSLKESDLAVIVVDAARFAGLSGADLRAAVSWERGLMESAASHGVLPLLVFNVRKGALADAEAVRVAQELRGVLVQGLVDIAAHAGEDRSGGCPAASAYTPDEVAEVPMLVLDLHDEDRAIKMVTHFIQGNAARVKAHMPRCLPEEYLSPDAGVFLNIPMDAETPSMRLLRPQALLQEEAIRHWSTTIAYRMDLAAARGDDPVAREAERQRFLRSLAAVQSAPGPKIMVTDSQAMDVVHPWTLGPDGKPLIDVTTFSIAMMHRQSGGQLPLFARGMERYKQLKAGDRVLIAEACNHNRITDACNDIGMVQIPQMIERHAGPGVVLDHTFGREFPDLEQGLSEYDLVIHCGACMIDHQKVRARISDAAEAGVPLTNYGLLMAYAYNGPDALARVLAPWGC
ncbi:unnamed protein product [Pedinophyceae sp. YPF-701]|nr:unnamed protein product [Pedinophyceae sp. YPF-701]